MKTYNIEDFKECNTCAAKLGSPTLCSGCLTNRRAISERDEIIDDLGKKLEIITLVVI